VTPGIGCSAKPDTFDPCVPIPGSNGSAANQVGMTFSSCPNPFYEEIAFDVPKPYARATVEDLPEFGRRLVDAAAAAFIQEVRPEGK